MPNITNIAPPRVPLTDPNTGMISREWYRFFFNLFNLTGAGSNDVSLQDLQLGPATNAEAFAEINQVYNEALLNAPVVQLGTLSSVNQDNVRYLGFQTVPSLNYTPPVGTAYWNGGTTLTIQNTPNVAQPVGEAQYFYIKATSAITKGQLIMFTGAVGSSGQLTGAPATGVTTGEYLMGVAAEDIALNSFGIVTNFGLVRGFNTTGGAEAWVDGQILYYDPTTPGKMTKTIPSAPNVKAIVAAVVNAGPGGSGSVFVRVSFGSKLGETDSNVQITSLTDGDLLQYDTALQYWKNVAPSSLVGVNADAVKVVDDTTTNATMYPVWSTSAAGGYYALKATTTKISFNPSTGILSLSGLTVSSTISGSVNGTAANVSGGAAGQILYQSAADVTDKLALGTSGYVLTAGATAPQYVAQSTLSVGTATNASNISVTNDTTTSAAYYPVWVTASTGNTPAYVSSTKFVFNPAEGAVGLGTTALTAYKLRLVGTVTGAVSGYGAASNPTAASDVTTQAYGFFGQISVQNAAFTITNIAGFAASQGTIGASATVTNQSGFRALNSLISGTNNYAFRAEIPTAANRYNFYASGTAPNWFSGNVNIFGAGSLGYTTGSGGAVTQATSKTTGVTLNKSNGVITMNNAALPAGTSVTFTLTNSFIAATDTLIVCPSGFADKYTVNVVDVAAGSAQIRVTNYTGGSLSEALKINFALIQAVSS